MLRCRLTLEGTACARHHAKVSSSELCPRHGSGSSAQGTREPTVLPWFGHATLGAATFLHNQLEDLRKLSPQASQRWEAVAIAHRSLVPINAA